LATQAEFPHTQHVARNLLLQGQIDRVTYLKLLRTQQYEAARVRQQPALELDENHSGYIQQGS